MRDEVFNKGCIPAWVGVGGSVAFAVLAIIVIPFLYTPVKWYGQTFPQICHTTCVLMFAIVIDHEQMWTVGFAQVICRLHTCTFKQI